MAVATAAGSASATLGILGSHPVTICVVAGYDALQAPSPHGLGDGSVPHLARVRVTGRGLGVRRVVGLAPRPGLGLG